ncbi:MAG: endopeptidase La [Candidatus Cloacimonetes bacterium]|nr:endopeptidase La [Candidatus Cloacimonadota bacterium]
MALNSKTIKTKNSSQHPVLPLRNLVMTPNIITPLLVGRKGSIEAVEKAYMEDKKIICVAQKNDFESDREPKITELYRMGTLCTILQIFRLPDNNIRLLVEGISRVNIKRYTKKESYLAAAIEINNKTIEKPSAENEALYRTFRKIFLEYLRLNKQIPEEAIISLNEIKKPDEFFYFVLANITADLRMKQRMLEIPSLENSIKSLISFISDEIEILKLENRIDDKVKKKLTKLQKDYYLTEQLKIIQRELGIGSDEQEDLLEFKRKITETNLNDEARKKAEEEFKRLSHISPHSQEYAVIHTYLSWILDLPWAEPQSPQDLSIKEAKFILDRDHYGLTKVKDRILEFLAVIRLADKIKGQIICFVGPPGVGKTSLGKSIAEATNRKFVRLSLGGVRDEAEIRGHRRTYVGALPGVIMQSMKRAGTLNPLIMMDEVDKLSRDFRGDPASALLEVLDPEQNNSFRDHYLDFGYDLSQVMFITTANSLNSIPQPLMDRMEIIRLPGYTMFDKYHIAKNHLIPKLLKEYKLEGKMDITFSMQAIETIISSYTREAGVRDLERHLSKIIRKAIKNYIEEKEGKKPEKSIPKFHIEAKDLVKYLGVARHLYSEVNRQDAAGIVTGLAWTPYGGETLQIEAVKMKGAGNIKLTGKLGETMRESAQAAHSYCRVHAKEFEIPDDFPKKKDLHLHIPEGAIPKDGPSAGVGIVTAFTSALSGKKVRADIAMTGEITLSGKVLPIGGLEEKIIAAKRAGIKTVIIPRKNEPELSEISNDIKKDLNIILVDSVSEVLRHALL